jgi:hypothetical protein
LVQIERIAIGTFERFDDSETRVTFDCVTSNQECSVLTITRRNLGPYRLIRFKQHETSRGVYWAGTLVCNGAPIGFIENCGDGRATQVNVADPAAYQALKEFLRVLKPQMPAHPSFGDLRESTLDWEFEENFCHLVER